MDGVGARAAGSGEQRLDAQVGLDRRRRPDRHGAVGGERVRRAAIGLGVDRDRGETVLPARARDADRDLAAVGDEDGLHAHIRKTPKRVAGMGAPSAAASASPSASRVSRGSRMPSSHRRAVA